jgi:RNase P subunit RPR2
MTEILYLLVGVVVGVAICPAIQYAQFRLKAWKNRNSVEIVDETKPVQCGACRNIILEPPTQVVVTKKASFKVYLCRQCSTQVTIPI